MSGLVVGWAFSRPGLNPTQKLVLVALADNANDDGGNCFPKQAHLADKTGLSTRTVSKALGDLEAMGLLERERGEALGRGRGRKGDSYRLAVAGLAEQVRDFTAEIQPEADSPSNSYNRNLTTLQPEAASGSLNEEPSVNRHTPLPPVKVGKTKATPAEMELAGQILAAFNQAAGTAYRSREYLAMIIRRTREYPRLALHHHRRIIDSEFRNPWWNDTPAPNVIYGSDATFERALNRARQAATKKPKSNDDKLLATLENLAGGTA